MAQTNCPDSWDQAGVDENGLDAEMNELTSATKSLNVDATPFVPGQNVFAKEFVPSFGSSSPFNSEPNSSSRLKFLQRSVEFEGWSGQGILKSDFYLQLNETTAQYGIFAHWRAFDQYLPDLNVALKRIQFTNRFSNCVKYINKSNRINGNSWYI